MICGYERSREELQIVDWYRSSERHQLPPHLYHEHNQIDNIHLYYNRIIEQEDGRQ